MSLTLSQFIIEGIMAIIIYFLIKRNGALKNELFNQQKLNEQYVKNMEDLKKQQEVANEINKKPIKPSISLVLDSMSTRQD